ncbi:YchA-1 [Escherichia coli H299]|nr:YchA-1 [Escherichia coli H299]
MQCCPVCRAYLRLPAAWRHPVVRPDSDRQLLAHLPVSAEPAGAVSGCRYGPMRENPWLAATVPVAPPLSRRDLRSRHPGKRPRDVRGNAVSQTALHVVAAGPCPLFCPVPFTCLSPCRRGLIQPQPSPPVQG